jgi:hypothetical protein
LAEGVLQMSLFAETPAEVEDQGRRYVLPKSDKLMETSDGPSPLLTRRQISSGNGTDARSDAHIGAADGG